MTNLASLVTSSLQELFTAPTSDGALPDYSLNAIAQGIQAVPAFPVASILRGNSSPELTEQSIALQYPVMTIYCDKLSNTLKEKYRVFSGSAQVVVEVRHSTDRIQGIQEALETYVASACQILDNSRGDWANGVFYAGGYDVTFGPVKRGGRNFLQIAKFTVNVDISV